MTHLSFSFLFSDCVTKP